MQHKRLAFNPLAKKFSGTIINIETPEGSYIPIIFLTTIKHQLK